MNYSRKNYKVERIFCLTLALFSLVMSIKTYQTARNIVKLHDAIKEQTAVSTQIPESITPESVPTPIPEVTYDNLGEFKLTAYCGCEKCCGVWGEERPTDSDGKAIVYTANQSVATQGVTVAADTTVLPFGTRVVIDDHEYIVQDRGGSVDGNHIDIYFESHEDALEFGVQYKDVFLKVE